MWVCSFAASCPSPPFPLLPSSLWGSGEWRGRGGRCAQYKSGSCIPCKRHHCHTSRRLCALLYQPLCFRGLGQHICSQIREMRCITTWSHDSHVTNSGACLGHWCTLSCRLICTGDMHLYGLTTCMCLLFLLSALLTRVVCPHQYPFQ